MRSRCGVEGVESSVCIVFIEAWQDPEGGDGSLLMGKLTADVGKRREDVRVGNEKQYVRVE
jgi:hypothetical protein